MIKVFLFGQSGRMGQELRRLIDNNQKLQYIGGYDRKNPMTNLKEEPDVIVDFSLPEAQEDLIQYLKNNPTPLVSGTTGLSENQKQQLQDLGSAMPVLWSGNMSLGVFLMTKLTEWLAEYDDQYALNVEETHHIHKKDKPSGTAIMIEDAAKRSTSSLGETVSIREGEVFGIHRFIAKNSFESIEIKHEAFNRGLFAQGALDVAEWLTDQNPGFYNMDDYFKGRQNLNS